MTDSERIRDLEQRLADSEQAAVLLRREVDRLQTENLHTTAAGRELRRLLGAAMARGFKLDPEMAARLRIPS